MKWVTSTITTAEGQRREITVCQRWEGGDGDGDDGTGGTAAPGGGAGGRTVCTSTPRGDLDEVRAVWRAINANRDPDPEDPVFTDDEIQDGTPDRVVERSWYRINGGHVQVLYAISCPGQPIVERWVTLNPNANGGLDPEVTPPDLIPLAWDRAQRQLPTPVPRVAPADLAPDGFAYVQTETFFWVDQTAGQWDTVTATASLAGLSLTVTVEPELLVVTTGDGATLQCPGAPPPFPAGADPGTFEGCGHVYEHSSATAPNGRTFPVTAAIVWHATWQASNGESGDLGSLTTTSTVRDLPVAEVQAVVVDG